MPGPEEELLYLFLLQLTREAAEIAGTPAAWPSKVGFSRGDLLRRMGWDNGKRRYAALNLAFDRLQAVSIKALPQHTAFNSISGNFSRSISSTYRV